MATGKREHKPIVILKEIDRSSPLLWSALVNNENLTTWQLTFWAPGGTGVEQQIYRIELVNASIASMRQSMRDNELQENVSLPLREELTFYLPEDHMDVAESCGDGVG